MSAKLPMSDERDDYFRELCDPTFTRRGTIMETLEIKRGPFHWAHGITFLRQNERGDVTIGFGGLTFLVPAEQWCSIIASVTPDGDNAVTFAAAQKFHG